MQLTYAVYEKLRGTPTYKDIQTFHHMKIPETLRVTNPNAYVTQHENLSRIKQNYTTVVRQLVMDNIDLVVGDLLEKLSRRDRINDGSLTDASVHNDAFDTVYNLKSSG